MCKTFVIPLTFILDSLFFTSAHYCIITVIFLFNALLCLHDNCT